MKKAALILIPLFLVLSSCQTGSDNIDSSGSASESSFTSSSSESEQSFSYSKETIEPIDFNAANVISMLDDISKTDNFTLKQSFLLGDASTSKTYITSKYIYYSAYSAGYLKLKSFDSEYTSSNEVVYQFNLKNDQVELLYPLVERDLISSTLYTSLDSFNYMLGYDASSLKEKDFKLEGKYLYTTNKELVKRLGSIAGYPSEAEKETFYKVKISFNKRYELTFVMQMFNDSYEIVDVPATKTTFSDVGKTNISAVDDYLSANYDLNLPSLTLEQANPLIFQDSQDVISLDNYSEVQIRNGDGGVVAKEEINRSESEYEHTSIDVMTSRRLTSLVRNNEDGIPSYIGLDYENKLSEEKFSKYHTWTDTYPSCSGFIKKQLKAFRKVADNQYRYYGYEHSSFFASLSNFNGQSGIKWIDIYLTNNKISKVIFTYSTFSDQYDDGTTFYYDTAITCNVVASRTIKNPVAYDEKENTSVISEAFSKFDGTHKFKIFAQNDRTSSIKYITTYDLNNLLKERTYARTSGEVSFINGYTKISDNQCQRFLIDEDSNAKPNGEIANGSLASLIGFALSPNLLTKTAEGEYTFDSYVLKKATTHMILGVNGEDILPSTLVMKIDEEKKEITSIKYDYDDGMLSSGSETISFLYDDDVKINDETLEKIANLATWVEPTSWKDDDEKIDTYLTKYFSDEKANVPYLYDPDIYSQWSIIDSTVDLEIYSNTLTGDDSKFYEGYTKLLVELGFEKTTLSSFPGAIIYVKGNISIRVAQVLVGGIYLWKTGEYN